MLRENLKREQTAFSSLSRPSVLNRRREILHGKTGVRKKMPENYEAERSLQYSGNQRKLNFKKSKD